MQPCRICGSGEFIQTRCAEDSPHYARLDCKGCGRFVQWAPWPDGRDITPGVWALALQQSPCPLVGSSGQVSMAKTVRLRLINQAKRENRPELIPLFNSIQDATWFVANALRHTFDTVRWPRVSQMAGGKQYLNRQKKGTA